MKTQCDDSGRVSSAKWKSLSRVRLCDSRDCSHPGSSVHGILQARILEWVAISFLRASSWPRDQTPVSCIAGGFFLPSEPQVQVLPKCSSPAPPTWSAGGRPHPALSTCGRHGQGGDSGFGILTQQSPWLWPQSQHRDRCCNRKRDVLTSITDFVFLELWVKGGAVLSVTLLPEWGQALSLNIHWLISLSLTHKRKFLHTFSVRPVGIQAKTPSIQRRGF